VDTIVSGKVRGHKDVNIIWFVSTEGGEFRSN